MNDQTTIATLKAAGLAAALCLLAACGQKQAESAADGDAPAAPTASAPAPAEGGAGPAREQAMLAYEHDVALRLPADQIAPRLKAAQSACETAKFGDCVVLGVSESGGDGTDGGLPDASLTVRIAPAGVEPMIRLAGVGGEMGSRTTRAEDLAVVVRDNALAQSRLRKERERLEEFQQRRDLAVADMIALSKQLADTDAQLQAAEQEGAQHRRRIDTQLLTLRFTPPGNERGRSEIGQALRDFGHTFSAGTAWTIRALAFLIPLAALVIVLTAIVRRLRRRKLRS